MPKKLNISYDSDLIESISADFDLRDPNKEALRKLVFTLDGNYDPDIIQTLNLATGVGKTYLMAAFIEYLRQQGVGNVVIVTPGKTVQSKTVQNFSLGSPRYIAGSHIPPDIVTPQDYSAWVARVNGEKSLLYGREIPVLLFIFNIQQLIAPTKEEGDTHGQTQDAIRRKPRQFDENAGVLFEYLQNLDDLVVIADESHLYSASAVAFNAALKELNPAATIGLTASVLPDDHVIYEYPLYRAIQDKYVKSPVLAFRKGGYGEDQSSEEQQLRDALQLRQFKQAYYDDYAAREHKEHLNAVLFVVCSNMDHATQISNLLRKPEYFGKELSVLQVDSQHDDEITQRLLEGLDRSDSPVLAVVSVNKLKEGWDVKNIAVVVTLRAMASEVLTQQTMGRGLRLPFGKYTGIWQIDQLDIISHQSFRELLAAENVLQQFGLEDAVKKENRAGFESTFHNALQQSDSTPAGNVNNPSHEFNGNPQDPFHILPDYQEEGTETEDQNSIQGNTEQAAPTVGVRTIGDEGLGQHDDFDSFDVTPVIISRNPRFADVSYKFPVTRVNLVQPPIDLSEISEKAIEEAARKVTSTGDVLYRKEIIAALGKKLRAIDAESAEVDSIKISDTDAAAALTKLVTSMQLVPSTASSFRYVESYLVPKFMKHVPFDNWTIKSLTSARLQLQTIVCDYIISIQRATKETPMICPTEIILQDRILPFGEKIYEPIDSRVGFVRGRVYSGWFKSLYDNESFDSYSGEYELARLLNRSPQIKWWHRLHPQYGAYIYYNSKDRYFPDFVALDNNGIYWIIEGKDKRGRDNDQVQEKRKAAEVLVRKLILEDEFQGQNWGYIIAYEDDIAHSDSWEDLKTLAQPVTNTL